MIGRITIHAVQRLLLPFSTLLIALRNPSLPRLVPYLLWFAMGYLLCPIDAKPDFLVGGFNDDFIVSPLLVFAAILSIPRGILKESKGMAAGVTCSLFCLALSSASIWNSIAPQGADEYIKLTSAQSKPTQIKSQQPEQKTISESDNLSASQRSAYIPVISKASPGPVSHAKNMVGTELQKIPIEAFAFIPVSATFRSGYLQLYATGDDDSDSHVNLVHDNQLVGRPLELSGGLLYLIPANWPDKNLHLPVQSIRIHYRIWTNNIVRFGGRICLVMLASLSIAVAIPREAHAQLGKDHDLPDVPEPMVFDLVRPLGAKKGEWEVNSLFSVPLTGRQKKFFWAPETEYVLGRGYAVEPQILFQNGQFQGFQLTGQKTFGTLFKNNAIHGALLRGEYIRSEQQLSSDAAYLFGARMNKRWSFFGIPGLRRVGYWDGGRFVSLLNASLFYHHRSNLILGVENNVELARHNNRVLITPQVHWTFTKNTQLQYGLGLGQEQGSSPRLSLIWRVVRQLR